MRRYVRYAISTMNQIESVNGNETMLLDLINEWKFIGTNIYISDDNPLIDFGVYTLNQIEKITLLEVIDRYTDHASDIFKKIYQQNKDINSSERIIIRYD